MKAVAAAVWILAAGGVAQGFQAAQAPAKGSIEGQVVNLKGGTPLKKANVQLNMINPGGPTPVGGRGQVQIRKAVETDDQGRFSFAGLDPGKYRLSADRQGFLHQNYGARKYSGSGTPVMVGDGQSVKGIVFSMNPQAVITGKVLDEDGEPVANVQVRAMRYVYRGGKKQWSQVGNATTTDIGEFRLPNLEPGRYIVASNARNTGMGARRPQADEPLPATPDLVYASTYYPSTPNAGTAVPIDVGAGGEIRGTDIRLVKTRVYRVRGKVTGAVNNERNAPIMVSLSLKDLPGNPIMGMANGPDGQFEIRNVAPGSYIATAQSRGRGQEAIAIQPVDVVGNHVDGIVLTMEAGKDVQGGVKVVDATTPPEFKNLSVMLRPVGFMGMGGPGRTRVGDDLKFTLKSVPAVRYAVSVTGLPDTCYVKSIQYGGRDVTEEGIEMTSGATLDVVVSAAAAQVDAVVMDKDGKAAWNATVALSAKDGTNIQVRTADENGILSLRGLKPGEYRLYAWEDVEPGAPSDPDFLKQYEGQAKSLKLDASGHEAVQLKAILVDEK
jgi:protocatechuate 3,4-dioxygenase beta subunit